MDCPEATVRTAPTRSVPRICFSTYPAAPAMIASNSASSSPNEVSIRQATSGILDRISRHTATPADDFVIVEQENADLAAVTRLVHAFSLPRDTTCGFRLTDAIHPSLAG